MRASRKQLTPGDKYVPWESEIAFSSIPLGSVARINTDALGERTEPSRILRYLDISSVSSDGKIGEPAEFEFANAPSRARRVLRSKDTIVSTVRTYLRAIAFVEDEFSDCIASTGFAVLSPRRVNPKFLYYWMRSEWMVQEVSARSIGVGYPAINADILGSLPIPKLTAEQQSRVVAFLDKRTAAIDQLISKKLRTIELLQEKRLALISQAVKRGLDSTAKMKPSGVAWLGDVPAHWEIKKLKHVAALKSGEMIGAVDIESEGQYPVYGGGKLRGYSARFTHDGKLILIGRQGALCGQVRRVEGKFWASEHAVVARPINADVLWVENLLRSMNLNQYSLSAAQPGLAVETIANLGVGVPPLSEQHQIGHFLEEETKSHELRVNTLSRSIELLREYRSALITAAVTGKIDVTAERSGSA